jgi:hypothetical protein
MVKSEQWTAHTASSGRTYYYDRVSGTTQWQRPAGFVANKYAPPPTLEKCLNESPAVASLYNAILKHCGHDALPVVTARASDEDDVLCAGGRGGGFCCASRRIFVCTHPWVSCREVAYELSHALNACRGRVHCRTEGMQVDGKDCGTRCVRTRYDGEVATDGAAALRRLPWTA